MILSYAFDKTRCFTVCLLMCSSFFIIAVHAVPDSYVVVFDIPSTLQVNQQTIRKDVPGFLHGATYALSKWTSKPAEAIENDFRNLLGSLGKQQGAAEMLVRDPEGRIVSELLAQWLSGSQGSASLIQCIKNYAEYEIFKDIAQTIFNGRIIAKHTNVIPSMVTCVEACEKMLGAEFLYLIGNWDPESFRILVRMPHTQALFVRIPEQNRFVSGLTRLLMPRNAELLFNQIATQARVPLDHIIFVSHMPYHIAAAQRLGIRTVNFVFNNPSETMQAIAKIVDTP